MGVKRFSTASLQFSARDTRDRSEEVTLHLVFTTRRGLAPAARVFINYLADHFVFRDRGQRPAQLLA
jgi:hypothetical protein